MESRAIPFIVALSGWAVLGPGQRAAEHPPLVSIDGTACMTCHDEILDRGESVHAPAADDCTTCHDFAVAAGATTVTLSGEEPSLCLLCHDDKTEAVEGDLETPHAPAVDSCVTCHDPHAAESPHLLLAAVPELCETCHDRADLADGHGGQLTAATHCTRCHGPHGTGAAHMLLGGELHAPFETNDCDACHRKPFGERLRLRARGERLCAACHGDLGQTADPGGSVHPALAGENGRAGCLSCHDPHLSDSTSLLLKTGPPLCAGCHGETVEAAAGPHGHAAAAEDCLGCHRPHTAAGPSLLDDPAQALCTLCHDPADADLAGVHLGADLARLECTSCHDPHGTGNDRLLARNVHPPIEDGCDTCHESAWNRLAADGSELCLICHEDIGEAASAAAVPHPALEVAACADCHNPHASSREHLVRGVGAEPCGDCHDDQIAGPEESSHGVIDLIGCQACHEPHGGSGAKLLRASGSELCLGCHEPGRTGRAAPGETVELLGRFPVSAERARSIATLRLSQDGTTGHPVTDHRVLGVPTEEERKRANTDFDGPLTCLTCHDPHKGRTRSLLRWGAQSSWEACGHCHER